MSAPLWYMTAVFVLYLAGLTQIRHPLRHERIMKLGILLDLGLTVYLEVVQAAIRKAAGMHEFLFDRRLLAAHIIISVLLLISYTLVWRYGNALLGRPAWWTRWQWSQTLIGAPLDLLQSIGRSLSGASANNELSRSKLRSRHRILAFTALTLYISSFLTVPGFVIERIFFMK